MTIRLQPIQIGDTPESLGLTGHPHASMILQHQDDYYASIGFNPPWISYFAYSDAELAGVCSFKGGPKQGKVEIAYFTFPEQEGQGYGTQMCAALLALARAADPEVIVTARTLPEANPSTSILKKNGFAFQGPVIDDEDGEVWEWVYPL